MAVEVVVATFVGALASFLAQRMAEHLRNKHQRDATVAEMRVSWLIELDGLMSSWPERFIVVGYSLLREGVLTDRALGEEFKFRSRARAISRRLGDPKLSAAVDAWLVKAGECQSEIFRRSERGAQLTNSPMSVAIEIANGHQIQERANDVRRRGDEMLDEIQSWYEGDSKWLGIFPRYARPPWKGTKGEGASTAIAAERGCADPETTHDDTDGG